MVDNLMFRKEIQEAQRITSTTDFGRMLWRRLLATMIGEYNRIPDMRVYLDESDIPEDMPLEKKLFGALHLLNERNIPPTADNLLSAMVVQGEVQEKLAQNFINEICPLRDDGNMAIESLSHFVSEDVKSRRNEKAWATAVNVITGNKGTAAERQEVAMNMVTAASGQEAAFEQGVDPDVTEDFFDWADVRYQEYLSGNDKAGPIMPWYGFIGNHGILPAGFDYGDMTLITAGSGYGKSTIVGQIAEENAYEHQVCDVLVILLETNLMKMKARSLARNCYIPYDLVKAKRLNVKDPKLNKVDAQGNPEKRSLGWYKKWVTESACEINYAFAPGASAYEITALMGIYRRKAEARGKGLLVIVDYLQKLNWRMFSPEQRVGLERVADVIRDGIEIQNSKSPVHLMMMAQENDESDPYGGKGVLQRSQVHISLQRQKRGTGNKWKDGDVKVVSAGREQVDAFGNPRYFHRAFDNHHSEATFVIRKSNDAPGTEVKVQFENALYKIWSHPDEIKKHDELSRP